MRTLWLAAAMLAAALVFPLSSAVAQQLAPTTNQVLLQQLYLLPAVPSSVETNVTVGTSATNVLLADPARVEDVISNTGASNCAVSHSNQVTITNGILLGSAGGSLAEDFRGDLSIPTEELWAVCAAAGGTLHVLTVDLQ
jgi:hypothetical protein